MVSDLDRWNLRCSGASSAPASAFLGNFNGSFAGASLVWLSRVCFLFRCWNVASWLGGWDMWMIGFEAGVGTLANVATSSCRL